MRFSVSHVTTYRYSAPIRLGPQILRLNPRLDRARLISRTLVTEPGAATRREATDAFGNLTTLVEFAAACDALRIESRFELEQDGYPRQNNRAAPPLPWTSDAGAALAPFLEEPEIDPAVRGFAARIAAETGYVAEAFLERLNQRLYADIDHHIRDTGHAYTPAQTLALGRGACRDVTMLFLACCRSLGAPARFVSGYQAQADTPDGRRHLHAWPEVWLPGGGWRGYDPTHGIAVTDGHVALCVAPTQRPTMPVEGGYWGEAVDSTLSYEVLIETRPA